MHSPSTIALYFQQLLPLSECEAHDGRVVGNLLIDLVASKPKDLAHAIRTFVNRMAMLRECGFRMGEFLVALLSAQPQDAPESGSAMMHDPASVTNEQAAAVGRRLAAKLWQPPSTAAAVRGAVDLQPALRTMRSRYAWFAPMLEVLLVQAAEHRRSTVARRRSSVVMPALGPEATDATAEESLVHVAHAALNIVSANAGSFDSVVRLVLRPLACCAGRAVAVIPSWRHSRVCVRDSTHAPRRCAACR
jgi:hypothetical protein